MRTLLKKEFPHLKNCKLFPFVSRRWKALGDAEQKPWKERARILKEVFDRENPDYVYYPRKPSEIKRRPGNKTKNTVALDSGLKEATPAGLVQPPIHVQPPSCFKPPSYAHHPSYVQPFSQVHTQIGVANPDLETQDVADASIRAETTEADITDEDIDDENNTDEVELVQDEPATREKSLEEILGDSLQQFLDTDYCAGKEHVPPVSQGDQVIDIDFDFSSDYRPQKNL